MKVQPFGSLFVQIRDRKAPNSFLNLRQRLDIRVRTSEHVRWRQIIRVGVKTMPKVSQDCLAQVLRALESYEAEVNAAPLTRSTKQTYILHADHFVRWLQDKFEPCSTKKRS